MTLRRNLALLFILFVKVNLAQNRQIDSLKSLIGPTNDDTNKVVTLNKLAIKCLEKGVEDPLFYIEKAFLISEKINFKRGKVLSLRNKGWYYIANSKYTKGLEFSFKSINEAILNINKSNSPMDIKMFKIEMAKCYGDIGIAYREQANYVKSLEYTINSLRINEEIKNDYGIARDEGNIGNIYLQLSKPELALKSFFKSLKFFQKINNKNKVKVILANIGNVYNDFNNYEKALEYYEKSLTINIENEDNQLEGNIFTSIGNIYNKKLDYNKALYYYNKALIIYNEINDLDGMGINLCNTAHLYIKTNQLIKAKECLSKVQILNSKTNDLDNTTEYYKYMSVIDSLDGNFFKALENFKYYVLYRDSINNIKIQKNSIRLEMAYEFDKKEASNKLLQEKKDFLVAEEKKKLNFILLAVVFGLSVVLIFSFFLLRKYKITQKQKKIIETQKTEVEQQRELADSRRIIAEEQKEIITTQKHLVEEKQKEILDSIHYASRIQRAMLTSEEYISIHLHNADPTSSAGISLVEKYPVSSSSDFAKSRIENKRDHFIFYKPKDIVAGDFYWAQHHNNLFYLCTADCTGHGVPGAFMSLLNIGFLNENVIERGLKMPHEILEAQRKEIIKALNPKGDENSKDGMDCVLAAFDFENMKLHFAQANNPLVIIRPIAPFSRGVGGVLETTQNSGPDLESNSTKIDSGLRQNDDKPTYELLEYKAQKMPIGRSLREHEPFELQTVDIQKGDLIYTWSDGYPDQFGASGKKFMSKNLKNLLMEIAHLPLPEQKEILDQKLAEHMGNTEQIDDVLVIGVRI